MSDTIPRSARSRYGPSNTRLHLQSAPQRLPAKRAHLRALSGATPCSTADTSSKKSLELLNAETSITGYTAHGEGVHGIVTRNGKNPATVTHDGVLAFANDPEPCLLQRADSMEMRNARNLWHYTGTSTSRTSAP